MDEDTFLQDECLICTESFLTLELACRTKSGRLRCVGACSHCSNICSICLLRIRVLQHSKKCPACTADLPIIICTDRSSASLQDYNIWGDNIGPDYSFDSRSSIFFPNDYYKNIILPLWLWKCNVCNVTKRDAKGLRNHVMSEHNLHICNSCVENKLVFPYETKIYNQSQYEIHLKKGDNDGSLGHPMCEFCRLRFFDKTLLFQHLSKEHYTCHICEKEGIQFKYYEDYVKLEYHFRSSHFLCLEKSCLEKKFIAFSSQIELHSHTMKWHPLLLNGSRSLPLHFKVANKHSVSNSLNSNVSDSYLINDDDNNNNNNHSRRNVAFDSGIRGRVRQGEWQIEIEDLRLNGAASNNRSNQVNPNQARITTTTTSSEPLLDDNYPTLNKNNSDRQVASTANWGVTINSGNTKEDFPVLGGAASSTSISWLSNKKGQKALKSNKASDFKEALNPSLSLGIQMHMGIIPAYSARPMEAQKDIQKDAPINQVKSNEKETSITNTAIKETIVKKPKSQIKSNKNSKTGWEDAFKSTGLISKPKKPTGFSVFKFDTHPSSGYKKENARDEDDVLASLDLSKLKPAGKFADNDEPAPIKSKAVSTKANINLLTSNEAISINTPNTTKPISSAAVSPRGAIQMMLPAPPPGFDLAPPPGFDVFPVSEGAPPPGFDVFPVGVTPPTNATLSRPSSAVPKVIAKQEVKVQKVETNESDKPIIRAGTGWVHIGGTSQSRNKQVSSSSAASTDPNFPSLPVQEKLSNPKEIEKVDAIKQNENTKAKKNSAKKNDDLKSLAFVKKK